MKQTTHWRRITCEHINAHHEFEGTIILQVKLGTNNEMNHSGSAHIVTVRERAVVELKLTARKYTTYWC